MKIETKLNVGQTAWFMKHNKPVSEKITAVQVRAANRDDCINIHGKFFMPFNPSTIGVEYFIDTSKYKERELFATLKDLLGDVLRQGRERQYAEKFAGRNE
jgi:hypothetical protein